MKKLFYLLMVLLFIIPLSVNAGVKTNTKNCKDSTDGTTRTCEIYISITDSSKFYGLSGKFNLTNATLKSLSVIDSSNFKLTRSGNSFYVYVENAVTNVNELSVLKAEFAIEPNCVTGYEPTGWDDAPSCEVKNNYYYNKSGLSVTESEYKADCGLYSCQKVDGKYYNKYGQVVSEDVYKVSCEDFKCEEYNGKYYDDQGEAVTEKEYKAACGKFSCETYAGKYYNKSGVAVTETQYKVDCGFYKCEKIGDKYFNDKGVAVTEKEYKNACGKYSCEVVDNEYYSKNGTKVTKAEYEKECVKKEETPKCKKVDDKYYGSLGTEVTKDVYEKECPGDHVKTGLATYSLIIVSVMLISGGLYIFARKKNYFN